METFKALRRAIMECLHSAEGCLKVLSEDKSLREFVVLDELGECRRGLDEFISELRDYFLENRVGNETKADVFPE